MITVSVGASAKVAGGKGLYVSQRAVLKIRKRVPIKDQRRLGRITAARKFAWTIDLMRGWKILPVMLK
jgi:hypothetical protein